MMVMMTVMERMGELLGGWYYLISPTYYNELASARRVTRQRMEMLQWITRPSKSENNSFFSGLFFASSETGIGFYGLPLTDARAVLGAFIAYLVIVILMDHRNKVTHRGKQFRESSYLSIALNSKFFVFSHNAFICASSAYMFLGISLDVYRGHQYYSSYYRSTTPVFDLICDADKVMLEGILLTSIHTLMWG